MPATATHIVKSGDKISSRHSSESSQSLSASASTEGEGGEADGAPDAATTVPAAGGGGGVQQRRVSAGGAGWMKLRSTVHMASAIQRQRRRKKEASRLSRQDSFLVKFSTRHSGTSSISSLASSTSLSGAGGDGVSRMTSVNDSRTSDSGAGEDGDAAAAAAGGHVTDADDDDDEDDMLCPPHARYVNADGTFMFYWLASVTAALLYNVWTTIARQGFPELQRDYSALWYTLDAVSDVIFVCDMAVQFRTGYLENGLVVYEASKLARYYRRSRAFYLDVACLTPLDLIQIWIGINPLLRFPRFLKVSLSRATSNLTYTGTK